MNQLPSLDDVVINSQLLSRPSRPPDYQAEDDALTALAQTMADAPQTILQKLVEMALQHCHADTAGISLLENHGGAEVFRSAALAGVVGGDHLHTTMPRNESPFGPTIDRDSTQLMHLPERVFPALTAVPPMVEVLLVPFRVEHKAVGILWVVAHDEQRKFDREDERLIKILGQFASAAWQLWTARTRAEIAAGVERQGNLDLSEANKALKVEIVEHKRAEDQLEHVKQDLETRVEERTHDLRRSIDDGSRLEEQLRQSQKMESIGTLAGGIAHDFANLLCIIQGYADVIIAVPPGPQQLIEYVQAIRKNTEQGAALVQQLLTIARKTAVKFEPTEVNPLLRRLAKLLGDIFPQTVVIDLALDPQLPAAITVDANQINQALLNLCINARDAMRDGGRLLLQSRTVSVAELPAGFSNLTSDKYVLISVSDTGSGMDTEIQSRVFEPFFTTKEEGKGTGLGLSMVSSIIRNHEGFIDIVSEPGQGSTFHIYLPLRNRCVR